MNRLQVVVVAVVVLLVVPGTATAVVRGEPDLDASAGATELTPGEDGTLELTVANSADLEVASLSNPAFNERVTTARGVEIRIRDRNLPFSVDSPRRLVGGIPDGASATIPFAVSVDENATTGTYRVPVEVEYTYTRQIAELSGVTQQRTRSRTLHVRVRIEADSETRFRVVGTTADVRADDAGTVSVTFENRGAEPARNTVVTLRSPNEGFDLGGAPESSRQIGRVAPGERRTVTYAVEATERVRAQPYVFEASATYRNADGDIERDESLPVAISVGAPLRFAIDGVDSELYVGEQGTISGRLRNAGDRTARNAVVVVESPSPNVAVSERAVAVGDLAPGASVPVEFAVDVGPAANDGPHPFTATVEYETAADEGKTSDPIRLQRTVGADREFFSVEPVNATFAADTSNRLVVRLTNVGETTQTDVTARLAAVSPFTSVSPAAYISRLEPGESAEVAFEVSVDEDAVPSTHALRMNVTSEPTDSDAAATDAYRVPVAVEDAESSVDTSSLAIVVVLGVAVVVAGGYWWFRRR